MSTNALATPLCSASCAGFCRATVCSNYWENGLVKGGGGSDGSPSASGLLQIIRVRSGAPWMGESTSRWRCTCLTNTPRRINHVPRAEQHESC